MENNNELKDATTPVNYPQAFPGWDMTFEQNPASGMYSSGTTPGMTLRDYFAAKAMQSILGNPDLIKASNTIGKEDGFKSSEALSILSYQLADAMLIQRNKTL
jgi:hypothetical protein